MEEGSGRRAFPNRERHSTLRWARQVRPRWRRAPSEFSAWTGHRPQGIQWTRADLARRPELEPFRASSVSIREEPMNRTPTAFLRLTLAAFVAMFAAGLARADVQTPDQQKCITSLNKSGAKVAAAQGKADIACVKNAAKGDELNATACLTADNGGKVATAAGKVGDAFGKSCGTLPDFGPTSATTVSDAAKDNTVDLATSLFGADVTSAVVLSSADSAGAKCQAAIVASAQKMANTIVKEFNACKAAGLKAATIDSASALRDCLDTASADLKGKIEGAASKVDDSVSDKCAGLDLDALLPGFCQGFTQPELCIAARARCSACTIVDGMDSLGAVCDRFDDGVVSNGTCSETLLATERVSIPDGVEPANTPGSPGVVVTNPKLLTQFPPSGPNL